MKTKEFIEKVQSIGYGVGTVADCEEELCVFSINEKIVLLVHTEDTFGVNTDWYEFKRLGDKDKEELLNIVFEYIKTPIEEREEPKKYYLRLPNYLYESSSYLNYNTIDKTYCFFGGNEFGELQTKFTQEEIDNLPNQEFIKNLIKEDVNE